MAGVLADLAVESEAATLTVRPPCVVPVRCCANCGEPTRAAQALRIAHSFDQACAAGQASEEEAFRRSATAVAKYWVCKRTPSVVCVPTVAWLCAPLHLLTATAPHVRLVLPVPPGTRPWSAMAVTDTPRTGAWPACTARRR